MNTTTMRSRLGKSIAMLVLVCLAGCSAERLAREGREMLREGRVEDGLEKLRQAARADPRDYSHRTGLANISESTIFEMLKTADTDLAAGYDNLAETEYRRVLSVIPNNLRALAGIDASARVRRQREDVQRALAADKDNRVELALDLLNKVLAENPQHREAREARRDIQARRFKEILSTPQLKSRYTKPISLQLRDAGLRQAFDALASGSGLNIIFDKEVRPDIRISIAVKNVLIEQAIAMLLEPNQLAGKVLNDNTLLVYPATAAKIREYQDLVIRSFYLENADVKQTQNMVKTMLKTKDTFIDEKLNLLVIRDTPEVIRLAEGLISVQDHAEPEVMLEIEVLEILRSRLTQLGIQYPDQWQLNSRGITGAPLPGTLNLKAEVGNSNLLSNPRIRVRNREKAKILIGNRIPVISSVVTPNVSAPVITDNIQYLDVGLKLEIEPNIHMDGSVMIKVSLEVSTLGDSVTTKNGTIAFRVGTRNASTVLQLRDGETQTLMGLIQDDDIEKAQRIPGLGDMPILGKLFSNTRNDGQKTEIVLGITPRIVRNVPRPTLEQAAIWSGTEGAFRVARPILNQPEEPAKPMATQAVLSSRQAGLPAQQVLAQPVSAPGPVPQGAAAAPAPLDALELMWKGPGQVKAGEEFTVNLNASSKVALNGASLQLLFDNSALTVVSVTEGSMMRSDNAQTSFTQRIDASLGRVYATIRRAAPQGATGDGPLIAVTFKATGKSGPTQVHVATAVPTIAGGATLPVKGSAPLQLVIGGPAGKP